MEIPQRLMLAVNNSTKLILFHPLTIYAFIGNVEGRSFLRSVASGQGDFTSHASDSWKDLGSYLKDKLWNRFTK